MLVPFECTIADIMHLRNRGKKLEYINKLNHRTLFKHAPYDKNKESEKFYRGILLQCTEKNGIINGSNLQDLNFPFDEKEYNIFISYSHNDEEAAAYLYNWFTSHGLSCFLDSTIWHSADKLLAKIDERYSMAEDHTHYDYGKRNFSTSHVHAMLSMAMLEAIDRSECCIFIKSENSVPLEVGIRNKTLSPWIYEENLFMDKIRRKEPSRFHHQNMICFSDGGRFIAESATENLRITHDLQCDFKPISGDDLFSLRSVTALDNLYEKMGIVSRSIIYG